MKFLGHEEEGWYSSKLNGQTGLFPFNYVEELSSPGSVSSAPTTDGKQLSSVTLLPYRVEELSQYSLCMHKCTCTVTCCRVPFVCLFHVNVFHGLLSVFIARACQLFNIAENGGWTGLEGSVSAALFTGE